MSKCDSSHKAVRVKNEQYKPCQLEGPVCLWLQKQRREGDYEL